MIKLFNLKLTKSELDLVFTEMKNAIDCGGEDQDFYSVMEKAKKLQIKALIDTNSVTSDMDNIKNEQK